MQILIPAGTTVRPLSQYFAPYRMGKSTTQRAELIGRRGDDAVVRFSNDTIALVSSSEVDVSARITWDNVLVLTPAQVAEHPEYTHVLDFDHQNVAHFWIDVGTGWHMEEVLCDGKIMFHAIVGTAEVLNESCAAVMRWLSMHYAP